MSATISVVVTTYEWPEALDVVLRAIAEDTEPPHETTEVLEHGSAS